MNVISSLLRIAERLRAAISEWRRHASLDDDNGPTCVQPPAIILHNALSLSPSCFVSSYISSCMCRQAVNTVH